MDVLRELKVSALTPNDEVFKTPKPKKEIKPETVNQKKVENTERKEENLLPELPKFDAELLSLYQKIPFGEDCAIESLTDENNDLRTVMKSLLKLEMGKFITILPGDRVKRNI